MKAIEFETQIEKGIIKVPKRYREFENNKVRIIVLTEDIFQSKEKPSPISEKDFFEVCGIWYSIITPQSLVEIQIICESIFRNKTMHLLKRPLETALAKKPGAADERICAHPGAFHSSLEIDAAIHANAIFQLQLAPPCVCLLYFGQRFVNEFLPAKARVHRHDQQRINLAQERLNHADRCRRVDG